MAATTRCVVAELTDHEVEEARRHGKLLQEAAGHRTRHRPRGPAARAGHVTAPVNKGIHRSLSIRFIRFRAQLIRLRLSTSAGTSSHHAAPRPWFGVTVQPPPPPAPAVGVAVGVLVGV